MQFCTQQRSKCQILLSMSVISPKLHFLGFFLLIYLFLFLLLLSSAIFLRVVLIWLFLMNEGNGKLDWKWKHNLLYITHRSWINSNFQLWVAFYFFLWLFLMNEGNRKLDWKWKNNLLCLTHRSWINLNFQLVATSFLGYTSCVD